MRWLIPLLSALFLSGCGTMADPTTWFGEPPVEIAKLKDLKNRIEPRVIWTHDTGKGSDEKHLGLLPHVTADKVYIADSNGSVEALDAASGRVLWQVKTDLNIAGGPGFGEGLVLLGTSDAEVVALDASNGQERWRAAVSSEVLAKPVAAEGVAVVHTIDGKLIGLDAANGGFRWQYDRQVPVLSLRGSGIPTISGSTVFCGLASGRVVALDIATGRSLWEVSITVPSGRSELERMADIDGEPLVLDGTVYVATYQGQVAAVGEGTGRSLWSKKLSSYNKVAIDWLRVYVADAEGSVLALGADSGDEHWRYDALQTRKLSAPAVFGGYVVAGDAEGYLHWFNAENGAPVARNRVGSEAIIADPVVLNGTLYVLGSGGDLSAIRLDAHRAY